MAGINERYSGVGNQIVDSDGTVLLDLNDNVLQYPATMLQGRVVLSYTTLTDETNNTVDVSNVSIIYCDTTSNVVNFGGTTNAVKGQVLFVTNSVPSNNMVVHHDESGGTQKINLLSGIDFTMGWNGGITLSFNGTLWTEVSRTA